MYTDNRGGHDYQDAVAAGVARLQAEVKKPIVERRCYCPDDCNCHHPWRFNYCGCRQHGEEGSQ